ncbi:hypothetical protein BHYA_0013g00500 [Botrytis hyacinthi]|uniref:Uncharacterized protein n=1 Tax=Botrytis hyacinthi TaxID=278943 RepID=A0A4Z1GYQ9_9HELO|nr:hypothetical protein BHYA_0013g00500 [Botrytis hyacinthi]
MTSLPVSENKYLRHVGQLTAKCKCKKNHIVCHHRSLIVASAVQKTKIHKEPEVGPCKCLAFASTIPAPQPETYTGHLVVLRNPTHGEWKSRPHRYLSPTLCNISPHYVQRFVEPPVREMLLEGKWPGKRHEFTLGKAQEDEIKAMQNRRELLRKEKIQREAKRKNPYEFEHQMEILVTKILEIRWKRDREEELCEYLETLVGVEESQEQQREFAEQKKEYLLRREELKKKRESYVQSALKILKETSAVENQICRLVEYVGQKDEMVLGDLGDSLEEQDEKERGDQERKREEEWEKRRGEGGGGEVEKNVKTEWVDESLSLHLDVSARGWMDLDLVGLG